MWYNDYELRNPRKTEGVIRMKELLSSAIESVSGFFMQLVIALSDIRLNDVLDILIVAFAIYKAIGFFKETRAKVLVKGLVMLIAVWILAQGLELITLKWILVKFFDYAIIAVAIIFHPEIRHALERVGHTGFGRRSQGDGEVLKKAIDNVCRACDSMSDQKIGALIVFERSTPLGDIVSTGTSVDAEVSEELVGNIFYPKSPLHDGGMILRDGRIASAGCILPLTANNELSKELGTRHRAAVGMTEASDAVVVVVSEETGTISVCVDGMIKRNFNQIELREKLYSELLRDETNDEGFFSRIFKRSDKKK